MNILFVSTWFPYPPNNGSKLRAFNLLRGLAQKHDVTLIAFKRETITAADRQTIAEMCRSVVIVPWNEYRPTSWRARAGFLSTKPRAIVDRFSRPMARAIQQTIAQGSYDVVIASEIATAAYADYFASVPAIFEDVETGVLYEQYSQAPSPLHRLRYGLTWAKHRRYLSRLLSRYAACTVVSQRERQLLRQALNGNSTQAEVIPNCIDVTEYEALPATRRPQSLIFTGSFSYEPNYEAMCWFLGQAYPQIRAAIPDVSLHITGNHGDRPLPSLDNVTLTGFVDDIRPLLASSTVSIAPIWTGSGTRLKILEAMAANTPVVSTTKGAEGLDVHHNEHLLIADTPQEFARAVTTLLQDAALRQRLAANAYERVARCYNWSAMLPTFVQFVEEIAMNQPAGSRIQQKEA